MTIEAATGSIAREAKLEDALLQFVNLAHEVNDDEPTLIELREMAVDLMEMHCDLIRSAAIAAKRRYVTDAR